MVRQALPGLAALLLIGPSHIAVAQDVPAAAPAHVSYVEGTAALEREGQPETAPLNMPVLAGDRLRTDDGRVEVLFGDGSALQLDRSTTVDVQSDALLRLLDGRVRLTLLGMSPAFPYRIDSPSGSVRIDGPGEYRIALLHGPATTLQADEAVQLELAVIRGAAVISTDQGETAVAAGQRAYAQAGLLPSYALAFNSATWDEFDTWAEDRRGERLGASAQYLPSDLRTYAPVFDEYGSWEYQQPYGYVWYPRVAAGWRPYYYGRWMSYPRYGWTWVGADRFAWPTHHYGRWGFSAGIWFWIPGTTWAPAYVSWAYAPGYVSWCPLGWNNRAVIDIGYRSGHRGYSRSRWRAWTVVSARSFGRGDVHRRVVPVTTLDARRAPAFEVRAAPPRPAPGPASTRSMRSNGAVPRYQNRGETAAPGTVAVPRYVNRGDQIIRSQTARPIPPRSSAPSIANDRAIPRSRIEPPPAYPRSSVPTYRTPQAYQRPGVPTYRTPQARVPVAPDRAQPRAAPSYEPRYPPRSRDVPSVYAPGSGRPSAAPAERPYATPRGNSGAPAYGPRPAPAPSPRRVAPPTAVPRGAPGGAVSRPHAAPAAPRGGAPRAGAPRGGSGGHVRGGR